MQHLQTLSTIAILCFSTPLQAQQVTPFEPPKVSYSATRVMTTAQGSIEQQVQATPDKSRSTTEMGGQQSITIVRNDLGVVWMVLPGGMYIESSLDDAEGLAQSGASGPETMRFTERRKVGVETVNGYRATKYKVAGEQPGDGRMDGFFWITDEQIPVRMDMDMTMDSGEKMSMRMELKNLVLAPQPASLFELPPGSTKMPTAGGGLFGGLFGGNAGKADNDQPGFGDQAADAATEGAKNATLNEIQNQVQDSLQKGFSKLFGN